MSPGFGSAGDDGNNAGAGGSTRESQLRRLLVADNRNSGGDFGAATIEGGAIRRDAASAPKRRLSLRGRSRFVLEEHGTIATMRGRRAAGGLAAAKGWRCNVAEVADATIQ